MEFNANQPKQKRKTHTSAAVKARWRKNHRDVIHIELPKGSKAAIRAFAADQLDEDGNGQSMTGFIMQCVYNCYPELQAEIQALRADSPTSGGALLL